MKVTPLYGETKVENYCFVVFTLKCGYSVSPLVKRLLTLTPF